MTLPTTLANELFDDTHLHEWADIDLPSQTLLQHCGINEQNWANIRLNKATFLKMATQVPSKGLDFSSNQVTSETVSTGLLGLAMISKSLIVLSTTTTTSIYILAALELIFLLVSLGVQAAFRMEYSDIKHVRRLSVVLIFFYSLSGAFDVAVGSLDKIYKVGNNTA
jgi:hypothetical protein